MSSLEQQAGAQRRAATRCGQHAAVPGHIACRAASSSQLTISRAPVFMSGAGMSSYVPRMGRSAWVWEKANSAGFRACRPEPRCSAHGVQCQRPQRGRRAPASRCPAAAVQAAQHAQGGTQGLAPHLHQLAGEDLQLALRQLIRVHSHAALAHTRGARGEPNGIWGFALRTRRGRVHASCGAGCALPPCAACSHLGTTRQRASHAVTSAAATPSASLVGAAEAATAAPIFCSPPSPWRRQKGCPSQPSSKSSATPD